jgi:hypothetical protein
VISLAACPTGRAHQPDLDDQTALSTAMPMA